jgi:Bacterial Ig-like domain (group 3)/FG-GAP-like repeat
MNKRTASLLVLVVLVSLLTFGSESQSNSTSAAASNHAASKTTARKKKSPTAPPTNIGFLSPTRAEAQGAIPGIFPAVMGDFIGNATEDAATMVNVTPGSPSYSISAAINDGTGNFTTVLTATPETQQDPIFVADLNGDGKDDVLLVHPATAGNHTYIQAWLSNGDGTFTAVNSGVSVTTTGFVWAVVTDVNGDKIPDVVVADSATPNGSIWTLLGNGDGTFTAQPSVAFTGAISPGSPTQGVPGNPMVFADFNGDGFLDFAAPAAAGGAAQPNQIVEYLCTSGSAPCTAYAAPVLLTTINPTAYDSCFLGSGNLGSTAAPQTDLISANCLDQTVTVYLNNGTGTFAQGAYYFAGARPAAISVADVNGDNNGDLIVTDLNSSAIKVLTGNGDGTLNPPTVGYVTGGDPSMPALIANFSGASNPVGAVLPDNQTNFVYLAGYGDGSFRSGINYYATNVQGKKNGFQAEGVGLASGDLNGDGIPDFVIGNANGGTDTTGITVFLGNANGSLQTGANYFPLLENKYSLQYVAIADFDGDGNLDIAASDSYNGVVQIFYGDGSGIFLNTRQASFSTGTSGPHPVGIVTADFNGDGKPDIAVVNNFGPANAPTSANIGMLINNGTGFNPVVSTALSTVATELTAADVNGDGKLDLVVPLYGVCSGGTCSAPGSAVAILLGNGDGTLKAETDFQLVNNGTTYLNPYDAAVGDLNGDGKADLAVTMQDVKANTQGIAVALGNGDGTFQTPTLLPSSPQISKFVPPPVPGYVKIADLNHDGHMDLVYTNAVAGSVGVMYGVGDGTFYTPVDFPANRWAWDFALVDVNGDGALDVIASGFEQSFSGVGVLLNTSGSSTALKSSLPSSVVGQSVTFTATISPSPVKGVTTTPTGTITFFSGTTALGPAVPISSGMASQSTTALPVGTDSITAQYSGDINYVPTTSAPLMQVVAQATSATATPTSSVNPSGLGQAVTFSTTVTSTVSGDSLVPTGTVNFNDGTTLLGPGTLNSSGVAAFTTSKLAAGTHSITAVYAGDTNFKGSSSSALSQVVSSTAAPASYTLTATPTTQTMSPGSSATYSIKVNASNYNGTVTFACPATLPTGVTCTAPGPSTAPSYAAGTLTLKTTAPTTAMMAPPANQRHNDPTLWASLMGVGMLGMVLAGDWKKRNRRALGIVLLVVALAMIMALAGCGGGSSSSGGGGGGGGGTGGTPAGSYPITLNATGAGINTPPQPQQLTVTLVVN